MRTWRDLEADYRGLSSQMTGIRLDIQWGAAGEYFRLAGGYNQSIEKRFYALSAIAGQMLIDALPQMSGVDEDVLNESNPTHCWFKGIWKISGNFEFGIYGEQKTDEGESAGFIYTGSIPNIAEASSVLCLELSALFPETEESTPDNEKQTEDSQVQDGDWKSKIVEALNLKPGLFGISVDLKKLFSRKKNRKPKNNPYLEAEGHEIVKTSELKEFHLSILRKFHEKGNYDSLDVSVNLIDDFRQLKDFGYLDWKSENKQNEGFELKDFILTEEGKKIVLRQ